MRKIWDVSELADMNTISTEILELNSENRILCFYGEMGAGKTTLIKFICRQLDVKEDAHSPSFSIVNEYETSLNEPIYHFDFYRLKTEDEAYDLGYEQYFYSGYFCLIEWPEKVPNLLHLKKADIYIKLIDGKRQITFEND